MDGLIDGFAVSADGTITPLEDAASAEIPKDGFVWLHFSLDHSAEVIRNGLGLDPMVSRSLLAPETRPRCGHLGHGVMLNLRGVNLNSGESPEDMLSLRCWLQPGRLITVRKRRSVAVEGLRERYQRGEAHDGPGGLLTEIITRLIDLIDPVADGLADGLDPLEARAARHGDDDALRDTISAMRHDAVIYRRYIGPMRDALLKLSSRPVPSLSERDLVAIQEEADRATRIVEELDISIERASVIVDQMAAARSERMNRNMMVLSVVSFIFLPLSFLTGLLGINVGGIPGAGTPHAFAIVLTICIVLGGAAGFYFKARDWI